MFKSKKRPIVIPQSEHARFAGLLASLWGNRQFDKPALDFQAFIKGVAFHDRGYGLLDNRPLGEVSANTWVATQREGLLKKFDDPVANLVSLIHIRRLLTRSDKPESDVLRVLAGQQIEQSLRETSLSLDVFEWADKITNWCDYVSFDFSFENTGHSGISVYPRLASTEEVTVNYHIEANGIIKVHPWPFSVERYVGFLVAYQLEGYPEKLEPVLMPFSLVNGTVQ